METKISNFVYAIFKNKLSSKYFIVRPGYNKHLLVDRNISMFLRGVGANVIICEDLKQLTIESQQCVAFFKEKYPEHYI